jgi:hypothetical protein
MVSMFMEGSRALSQVQALARLQVAQVSFMRFGRLANPESVVASHHEKGVRPAGRREYGEYLAGLSIVSAHQTVIVPPKVVVFALAHEDGAFTVLLDCLKEGRRELKRVPYDRVWGPECWFAVVPKTALVPQLRLRGVLFSGMMVPVPEG